MAYTRQRRLYDGHLDDDGHAGSSYGDTPRILTAGSGVAGGGSGFWSGVGSSVVGSSGRDLTYGRSGFRVGLLCPVSGPFLRTVLPSLGRATFMRCGAWRLRYGGGLVVG